MKSQTTLNFRVTEKDAETLAAYSEMIGSSQTSVIKNYIRGLEVKLSRPTASTVEPMLLPSLPLSMKAHCPKVSCVYFLLTQGGDVLYIGESGDLKKRFIDHHKTKKALTTDKNSRIHWVELSDSRKTRKTFEQKSIERFSPKFNER